MSGKNEYINERAAVVALLDQVINDVRTYYPRDIRNACAVNESILEALLVGRNA